MGSMRLVVTIPPELPPELRLEVLRGYIRGVVATNRALLRLGVVPQLYDSGVVYTTENGPEQCIDAAEAMRRGATDCAGLTAWRVAELQEALADAIKSGKVKGRVRWPEPLVYQRAGTNRVHCQVRHSDGRREDPSRLLGMGRQE